MKRANGIIGDAEYEDDGNYGSAATIDVEVLQAISKRVHYGKDDKFLRLFFNWSVFVAILEGKFVSESKFIEHPSAFVPHIQNSNRSALEALITKPEVERKLLLRLRKKATLYAQDFAPDGEPMSDPSSASKIDVDGVVELYEHYIIPLTKEVEVCQISEYKRSEAPLTNYY
jgi:chorismate mutase